MLFPFWDPTFILIIPAMILAFWAQYRVKKTYRKFAEVESSTGLTGAQVAKRILATEGVMDVTVEAVEGELTDHYDPKTRTVRLSEGIYDQRSVAALGIAAHEVGHAVQHNRGYAPLAIRSALLVPANLGSTIALPMFFIGMFFSSFRVLMDIGIFLFLGALAFQLITLPVEFDASRRAIASLRGSGMMANHEVGMAQKVLAAAALTYVAALAVTLSHLIRMLILRDSRD
jgi:Zn-dependent membrane protease YugP